MREFHINNYSIADLLKIWLVGFFQTQKWNQVLKGNGITRGMYQPLLVHLFETKE